MALPSVQDIYRYLNEDPERVPFTGDKRRQAIIQLANQEARQQRNNRRALDLLLDKAAPNQKTTPERSAKESGKPVEAKRKGRFDLDIIQEFDVNDLQWGQPSKNQGKKMQRPIKTMDLDVSDLALPPFSANDSPETYQELLEIQEMGLLRDQRQKDISSQQTKEGILSEFKEYADAHSLLTNWDFVRMVMDDVQTIVLSLKFAFNRPRPDTLAQHLGIILSVDGDGTFHTPAYPSYHSTVSRLIAEVMAGAYVGHKTELLRIADKIGMNRVIAGYHYMSDHQAGLVLANQLVLKITTNLSINPVYEKEETIDSKTAEAVTENFMDTLEEVHRRGEAVKKEDEGEYEDSYMEAVRMAIGRHADETAFMTDVNKADEDSLLPDVEKGGFNYQRAHDRVYGKSPVHVAVYGANDISLNGKGSARGMWKYGAPDTELGRLKMRGAQEGKFHGHPNNTTGVFGISVKRRPDAKAASRYDLDDTSDFDIIKDNISEFLEFALDDENENMIFHIPPIGITNGGFGPHVAAKVWMEAFKEHNPSEVRRALHMGRLRFTANVDYEGKPLTNLDVDNSGLTTQDYFVEALDEQFRIADSFNDVDEEDDSIWGTDARHDKFMASKFGADWRDYDDEESDFGKTLSQEDRDEIAEYDITWEDAFGPQDQKVGDYGKNPKMPDPSVPRDEAIESQIPKNSHSRTSTWEGDKVWQDIADGKQREPISTITGFSNPRWVGEEGHINHPARSEPWVDQQSLPTWVDHRDGWNREVLKDISERDRLWDVRNSGKGESGLQVNDEVTRREWEQMGGVQDEKDFERDSEREQTKSTIGEPIRIDDSTSDDPIEHFAKRDEGGNLQHTVLSNYHDGLVSGYRLEGGWEQGRWVPDGKKYPTAEHAYKASKFKSDEARERIRKAPTPFQASKIADELLKEGTDKYPLYYNHSIGGKRVHPQAELTLMGNILQEKFEANPRLREELLATGDADLVEGQDYRRSPDTYWGRDLKNPKDGDNQLGELLVRLRKYLRDNPMSSEEHNEKYNAFPFNRHKWKGTNATAHGTSADFKPFTLSASGTDIVRSLAEEPTQESPSENVVENNVHSRSSDPMLAALSNWTTAAHGRWKADNKEGTPTEYPVKIDGVKYKDLEEYYGVKLGGGNYHKFLRGGDRKALPPTINEETGKVYTSEEKIEVMAKAITEKFKQYPELAKMIRERGTNPTTGEPDGVTPIGGLNYIAGLEHYYPATEGRSSSRKPRNHRPDWEGMGARSWHIQAVGRAFAALERERYNPDGPDFGKTVLESMKEGGGDFGGEEYDEFAASEDGQEMIEALSSSDWKSKVKEVLAKQGASEEDVDEALADIIEETNEKILPALDTFTDAFKKAGGATTSTIEVPDNSYDLDSEGNVVPRMVEEPNPFAVDHVKFPGDPDYGDPKPRQEPISQKIDDTNALSRRLQGQEGTSPVERVEASGEWGGVLPHNFNFNRDWKDDPTPDAPNTPLHAGVGNLIDAILMGIRTATSRPTGRRLTKSDKGKFPEDIKKGDDFSIPRPERDGGGYFKVRATRDARPMSEVPRNEHPRGEGWSNKRGHQWSHDNLASGILNKKTGKVQQYTKIDFELVDDADSAEAQRNFLNEWNAKNPDSPLQTPEDFQAEHARLLPPEQKRVLSDQELERTMIFHSGLAEGADHLFGKASETGDGVDDNKPYSNISLVGHTFPKHTKGRFMYKKGHFKGKPVPWKEALSMEKEEQERLYYYDEDYGISPHGAKRTHQPEKLFDRAHKNALLNARDWIQSHGAGFDKAGNQWGEWIPDENDPSKGKWEDKELEKPSEIESHQKTMKLMGRNVEQVAPSDAVVAVTPTIHRSGVPVGIHGRASGTAWAVAMGIQKGIPVYVYDERAGGAGAIVRGAWKEWNFETKDWDEIVSPPYYKEVATIGSRDINETSSGGIAIKAWVDGAKRFQQEGSRPFAPPKRWDKTTGGWEYAQEDGEEIDKHWTQDKIVEDKIVDTNAFANPIQREQVLTGDALDAPEDWVSPEGDDTPDLTPQQETFSRADIAWAESHPDFDDKSKVRSWVIEKYGLEELLKAAEEMRDDPLNTINKWGLDKKDEISDIYKGLKGNQYVLGGGDAANEYLEEMGRYLGKQKVQEVENLIESLHQYALERHDTSRTRGNTRIEETIKGNFDKWVERNKELLSQDAPAETERSEEEESQYQNALKEALIADLTDRWVNHYQTDEGGLIQELGLEDYVTSLTGDKRAALDINTLVRAYINEDIVRDEVSAPLSFERYTRDESGGLVPVYEYGRGEFSEPVENPDQGASLPSRYKKQNQGDITGGEAFREFDPEETVARAWAIFDRLVPSDKIVKGSDLIGINSGYGSDDNKNTRFYLKEVLQQFVGFDEKGNIVGRGEAISPTDDGPAYSLFNQLIEAAGDTSFTPAFVRPTDPKNMENPVRPLDNQYRLGDQLDRTGMYGGSAQRTTTVGTAPNVGQTSLDMDADERKRNLARGLEPSRENISDPRFSQLPGRTVETPAYREEKTGDKSTFKPIRNVLGQENPAYASVGTVPGIRNVMGQEKGLGLYRGSMNTWHDLLEFLQDWSPEAQIATPGTGESDDEVERTLGTKWVRDKLDAYEENNKQIQEDLDSRRTIEENRQYERYVSGRTVYERMLKDLSPEAHAQFMSMDEDERKRITDTIMPHANAAPSAALDGVQFGTNFNFPDVPGEHFYTNDVFTKELMRKWALAPVEYRREKMKLWEGTSRSAWGALPDWNKDNFRRVIGTKTVSSNNKEYIDRGFNKKTGKYDRLGHIPPSYDADFQYLSMFLGLRDDLEDSGIANLVEDGHFGFQEKVERATGDRQFKTFLQQPNALNILIDDVLKTFADFRKTGKGTARYLNFSLQDNDGIFEEGAKREVYPSNFKALMYGRDQVDGNWVEKKIHDTDYQTQTEKLSGYATLPYLIQRLKALGEHRDSLYTGEAPASTAISDSGFRLDHLRRKYRGAEENRTGDVLIDGQNQWEDLTGMHHVWDETEEGEKPKYTEIILANGDVRKIEARTPGTYLGKKAYRNTEFFKQVLMRHLGRDDLLTGIPDVIKRVYAAFPNTPSKYSPFNNKSDVTIRGEVDRLTREAMGQRPPMAGFMGRAGTRELINSVTGEPEELPVYNESFDPEATGESLLSKFKELALSFGTAYRDTHGLGIGEIRDASLLTTTFPITERGWGEVPTGKVETGGSRLAFPMNPDSTERASMIRLLKDVIGHEKSIRHSVDKTFEMSGGSEGEEPDSKTVEDIKGLAGVLRGALDDHYTKIIRDSGGDLGKIGRRTYTGSDLEMPGGSDTNILQGWDALRQIPKDDYQAFIAHLQNYPEAQVAINDVLGETNVDRNSVNQLLTYAPYVEGGEKDQEIDTQLRSLAEVYTPQVRGMMHKIQHDVLTDANLDPNYISKINWMDIPKEYRLLTGDDTASLSEQIQEYRDSFNSLHISDQNELVSRLSNGALHNTEEFFNTKNPNSIINWAYTASQERFVRVQDIPKVAALNVMVARPGDLDLKEEAYAALLHEHKLQNLSEEDLDTIDIAHQTDREDMIEEATSMLYQGILNDDIYDNQVLIREFQTTTTGEEVPVLGEDGEPMRDENGDIITSLEEAPMYTARAIDPDDPWSDVGWFDEKGNQVWGRGSARNIFASDWGTNYGDGLKNVRNARNAYMDQILASVTSHNKNSGGQVDARQFLDTFLDVVARGDLPVFFEEAVGYGLDSIANLPPRRTASGKGVERKRQQQGSALKFIQTVMRRLYEEKGMEIPDATWEKFNKINSVDYQGYSSLLDAEEGKRRDQVRNIISNHAIRSHDDYGMVFKDLEQDLMDFYSEEGAEHNGHLLHWSGSGHETFKDWANERLDEKHAELQVGQVETPTQTYKPALPASIEDHSLAEDSTPLERGSGSQAYQRRVSPLLGAGAEGYETAERDQGRRVVPETLEQIGYTDQLDPSWRTRKGGVPSG